MRRTRWTFWAAVATLALFAITACGGASPTAPTRPTGNGDVVGQVSDNHGHSVVITKAQLAARQAVVLDIKGTASHGHLVEVGAQWVVQLADTGQCGRAFQSSITEGHSHWVSFH
jgi:hypothetical protein